MKDFLHPVDHLAVELKDLGRGSREETVIIMPDPTRDKREWKRKKRGKRC
jgi:hypothetical protein